MPLGLFSLSSACLVSSELYRERIDALTDHDGDGYAREAECDDADDDVHPGAVEVCDGIDQDCDGWMDEDASDAPTWYLDADGDGYGGNADTATGCDAPNGYAGSADDCDDGNGEVHPGADDAWYDGIDANCDGADDFDADGDGDRASGYGGDCDDQDATVSSRAEEGWYDAGIDNDCDGDVSDQARVSVDEVGTPIDGEVAGGGFGTTLATIPAGWIDPEPVLLAAAPFTTSGDVYGWRAAELSGTPSLATASWHLTGGATSDYFGYGMGWAGDAGTPLVAIGAEGADGTRGALRVWRGEDWGSAPTFSITGASEGMFFGGQVVSGYDHDGDGIDDLLATAPLDSRVAANAGVAFIFLAPDRLTSDLSAEDADVILTNRYAGAIMTATNIGDSDGDGLEDLALSFNVSFDEGPGAVLLPGGVPTGTHDAEEISMTQFWAAGDTVSMTEDWDLDGRQEILVSSGGVERYTLPLAGAVYPWEDADARMAFPTDDAVVTLLRSRIWAYGDRASFLLGSHAYEGSRGGLFITPAVWDEGSKADEGQFAVVGEFAGDQLSYCVEVLEVDSDPVPDFAIGAPGWDGMQSGSGAVYIVLGPH